MQQLTLVVLKTHFAHYLPRLEVHSTCNFHSSFMACIFADLANQGHLAVQLYTMSLYIHANFTSHTNSSALSSNTTHSQFIISTSKEAVFANFLFYNLLLLNSNERLMEALAISTVLLGSSHANSNCSQTHRKNGHCTCIYN